MKGVTFSWKSPCKRSIWGVWTCSDFGPQSRIFPVLFHSESRHPFGLAQRNQIVALHPPHGDIAVLFAAQALGPGHFTALWGAVKDD